MVLCIYRLSKLGINPRTKDEASGSFSNVVFSAPPYQSEDFVGEIKDALAMWNGKGSFVYTSSTGVYGTQPHDVKLTEDSKLAEKGKSESTDRLMSAESVVLEVSPCVDVFNSIYVADAVVQIHFTLTCTNHISSFSRDVYCTNDHAWRVNFLLVSF